MWRLLQLWHWKSKIGWGSREEGWRRWGETSPSSDSLSTLTRCWFYLWCTQCHQHQASPSESHFSGGGGEEHDRLRGGGRTWGGCQSCWCWCWFLFLNLAKIHIFIPKSTEGGGGVYTGLEIFLKRKLTASLTLMLMWTADGCDEVAGGVWQWC